MNAQAMRPEEALAKIRLIILRCLEDCDASEMLDLLDDVRRLTEQQQPATDAREKEGEQ